ncbi:MAG: AAA family ATPase, partial [Burkholderiales bacterium]
MGVTATELAGRLAMLPAARVFAVTSGKGGVGKTNTVANLAAALARQHKKVLLMDADLGLANLDLFLGVKPRYTLADFFAGHMSLAEIIVSTRSRARRSAFSTSRSIFSAGSPGIRSCAARRRT